MVVGDALCMYLITNECGMKINGNCVNYKPQCVVPHNDVPLCTQGLCMQLEKGKSSYLIVSTPGSA